MSSGIISGNILAAGVASVVLTPAEVAANTSAEQTFTVPGLRAGDAVFVNKPTTQAGLGIVGARASASDTVAITFVNATSSPITPTAAETYCVTWVRPDATVCGVVV